MEMALADSEKPDFWVYLELKDFQGKTATLTIDDLPEKTCIGFRKDHVDLPVYINDIESLFWVLGIYCAEGWSRSNKSSYQVSVLSQSFLK